MKSAKSFLAGATQFWTSIANKIMLVKSRKLWQKLKINITNLQFVSYWSQNLPELSLCSLLLRLSTSKLKLFREVKLLLDSSWNEIGQNCQKYYDERFVYLKYHQRGVITHCKIGQVEFSHFYDCVSLSCHIN